MKIKYTIVCQVKEKDFERVCDTLNKLNQLRVAKDQKKENDLVCFVDFEESDVHYAVNFCHQLFGMKELEIKQAFPHSNNIKTKIPSKDFTFLIPMGITSVVTFIFIYQVLFSLNLHTDIWIVLGYAALPTIGNFLSQLAHFKSSFWLSIFKKIKN